MTNQNRRGGRTPAWYLVVVCVLAVFAVGAALRSTARPSDDPTPPLPPTSDDRQATPGTGPRLQSDELADVWVRAFLTRPGGPDDQRWIEAIRPLSSEEVVREMIEEGTAGVGIALPTWRVARIDTFTPDPPPIPDSATCRSYPQLVTVTDGTTDQQVPYLLTACRDDTAGRWKITIVEHAYVAGGDGPPPDWSPSAPSPR